MSTLAPETDFGALYGEENRCPHCGALSRIERDAKLRWVCAVCGGPRVPAKVKLGEEGIQALRNALSAKRAAAVARVGSWVLGLTAALALTFGVAVGLFGILLVVGVVLAILAALCSRTSRRSRAAMRSEVAVAWEQAIKSLLEASGHDATAKDIARSLGVPEAEVETALTTLSATGRTRVDIGEDADLHYQATDPAPADKTESDDLDVPKTKGSVGL